MAARGCLTVRKMPWSVAKISGAKRGFGLAPAASGLLLKDRSKDPAWRCPNAMVKGLPDMVAKTEEELHMMGKPIPDNVGLEYTQLLITARRARQHAEMFKAHLARPDS